MIQDIAGYQKLNEWIEENCNQIGDVVDKVFWSHIGGNCHVQTKMKFNPVSDSIYVDVGLGFRLPLSFQDAKVVSLERIKLLGGKLVLLQRDIDSVVADIEQVNYFIFYRCSQLLLMFVILDSFNNSAV